MVFLTKNAILRHSG